TAIDNCGTATVALAETTTAGSCANNFTVTRTWTATDECGNVTIHVQTITVADTVKPVFTGSLPTDVTVSCVSQIPATVEGTLTATDNCTATANIVITVNDVVSNVSPSCAN